MLLRHLLPRKILCEFSCSSFVVFEGKIYRLVFTRRNASTASSQIVVELFFFLGLGENIYEKIKCSLE